MPRVRIRTRDWLGDGVGRTGRPLLSLVPGTTKGHSRAPPFPETLSEQEGPAPEKKPLVQYEYGYRCRALMR